jgi:CelD/BcsL family acetyltransferase involved in cellulose biosynthesis
MTLQVGPHSFASIREEWEQLTPYLPIKSPFLTWRWQNLWWEIFGEENEPLLWAFHHGGQPIGIAPLMRQGTSLSFIGETDLFDYHDFIVPTSHESTFYPVLVAHLASQEWETITLTSLPQESPTMTYLPELAKSRGWSCQIAEEDVSPGAGLPTEWDTYLGRLSKKDRHELRRKLRRLESTPGVKYTVYSSPEHVPEAFEDFLSLMAQSRDEKRTFLTEPRARFLRALTKAMAEEGILRLCFLEDDGKRIAAAICFDYQGQRFLYNSGFDHRYNNLSVGLLVKVFAIQQAISQGQSYFDFLRGNEPYKYDLGGVSRSVYQMILQR